MRMALFIGRGRGDGSLSVDSEIKHVFLELFTSTVHAVQILKMSTTSDVSNVQGFPPSGLSARQGHAPSLTLSQHLEDRALICLCAAVVLLQHLQPSASPARAATGRRTGFHVVLGRVDGLGPFCSALLQSPQWAQGGLSLQSRQVGCTLCQGRQFLYKLLECCCRTACGF